VDHRLTLRRTIMIKPSPACFLIAIFVFSLLTVTSRAANHEDAKLETFFKKYLDQEFRLRPLEATQLGDHRFDDQLDDVSPAARAHWKVFTKKTLDDLKGQIDYHKLSRAGQIDDEILRHNLEYNLWLLNNVHPYEDDPRTYSAYVSDSIYLLLAQSSLPKEENIRHAIARVAQIPRVVEAAKESLQNPPSVFVDTAIRQNRGAIGFYEHGIFDLTGDTLKSELTPATKKAAAVLRDYQKWLENDLRPRAHGEWRIGRKKFYRKLDLELDSGISADEVLREAESDFTRVRNDMYVIARQLWSQAYPKQALPPDDAEGRRQTIALVLDHYNRDHGKPADLVREAKADVKRIKAFIRANDILRLPEPDTCQVIEMPEFQRGNSMAFLNPAPPLDAKADSIYAISPPPSGWDAKRVESFMGEYNSRMLNILTIHEGYPGHYVQLTYSNRDPSLIRRVLSSGTFAEGWAVYCEQMMLDQGYGHGDPVLRLNQLKWYLRTVANAILDHKMHCDGMTDAEALKFLTVDAFQTEGEAIPKIVRSKQSSCQLSTYFVGRTAFYRLRQTIEREQGKKFSLGRYHEAVLANGTLPVKYLPELVRARLKQPR
jgi:uncharacterized protein (DUF885 family)